MIHRAVRSLRRALRRWWTIAILALLPTVSRQQLIADARRRGACHVVEPGYDAESPSVRGPLRVSEFVVVTVPDVLLVGPSGLPITRDGRIIKEPVSSPRGNLYLPAVERAVASVGLRRLLGLVWFPRRARSRGGLPSIAAGVHVITRASPRSGGSQYGHWLLEHAGQIAGVEHLADRLPRELRYVTNEHVASYQDEVFDALGVAPERILPHREPVLRVNQLVVPTLRNAHSRGSEHDPRLQQRVRAALTRSREGRSDEGLQAEVAAPWLAFALREDDPHRHATNELELRRLLLTHGGYRIRNGVPLHAEVEALQECRVLVGIFGAGLAKMLLCPELRSVIELAPPGPTYDVYEKLAAGLDVRYRRIVGQAPAGVIGGGKNIDFFVPPAALEEVLDDLAADLDTV